MALTLHLKLQQKHNIIIQTSETMHNAVCAIH